MTDTPEPEGEEILFRSSRFQVHRVRTQLPSGALIEKEIIRHPGAVVILPILDDGRVVMIENYRYSIGRNLLELPAGTRERDEPAEQTAARELVEETGFVAGRLRFVQSFFAAPGILDEQMQLFVATQLTQTQPRREEGEQICNRLLSWPEIESKLRRGGIQDAKTLVGLLLGRDLHDRTTAARTGEEIP
ncbi:NUDIX hydrolase [Roseimaritima sediminicola]|uniref:NUDIX hydrolase n=1 Tax=Roseimaritima sediminicola TaxID=2662066 RepID=UPI00129833DF|nr:NUDIX hydrolase [Roseimaritima sediminicola]